MKVKAIGAKGLELTKVSELFKSKPYLCPAGVWTQGYGTTKNPDTGKMISPNDPAIDLPTALRWLEVDYAKVYFPISDRLLIDTLSQNEIDALLDFTYNTGGYWTQKRTGKRFPYRLYSLVNDFKTGKATEEELREYWLDCAITGGGKVWPGLITRRRREIDLFFTENFK